MSFETGVFDDNFHSSANYLLSLGQTHQLRYINEGSFYPSLSHLMLNGDYQKVLNGLHALGSNFCSHFQTPVIRLSVAGCFLGLNQLQQCNAEINSCKKQGDLSTLDELCNTNCKAYLDLKNYIALENSEIEGMNFEIQNLSLKG